MFQQYFTQEFTTQIFRNVSLVLFFNLCSSLSVRSVAPRVVARSPSVHEDGESLPIPMVTLDHALPVTSLQIWLADGRRLVQRFNLSHRCVSLPRDVHSQS